MKLNELLEVMNDNQLVDVYYKDGSGNQVKCASRNMLEHIDERYEDADIICVTVTKYNTFDVLIEKPKVNKRYTVKFEIPNWIDLDEEIEIEFEDDEDEREIEDRIEEEFRDWLQDKLRDLGDEATSEVIEIEEY